VSDAGNGLTVKAADRGVGVVLRTGGGDVRDRRTEDDPDGI